MRRGAYHRHDHLYRHRHWLARLCPLGRRICVTDIGNAARFIGAARPHRRPLFFVLRGVARSLDAKSTSPVLNALHVAPPVACRIRESCGADTAAHGKIEICRGVEATVCRPPLVVSASGSRPSSLSAGAASIFGMKSSYHRHHWRVDFIAIWKPLSR